MSVTATHTQTHSHEWVFKFNFTRDYRENIALTYDVRFSQTGYMGIFKGPVRLEFDFDHLVERVEHHAGIRLTDEERVEIRDYFVNTLPPSITIAQ